MNTQLSDNELDLLVAYALNIADLDETVEVERMLRQRPELRQVLAELRATGDALPDALPEPVVPDGMRQRVLDYAVGRAPARAATKKPTATPRPWGRLFGALSGALALAVLALALQLGGLRAQVAALQMQRNAVVTVAARANGALAMAGTGGSGTLLRADDGAYMLAARLPQLEAGRIYQLWFIEGQAAPASAGTFIVDETGYGIISQVDARAATATTVAVTNEPSGGSPGPTTPSVIAGTK